MKVHLSVWRSFALIIFTLLLTCPTIGFSQSENKVIYLTQQFESQERKKDNNHKPEKSKIEKRLSKIKTVDLDQSYFVPLVFNVYGNENNDTYNSIGRILELVNSKFSSRQSYEVDPKIDSLLRLSEVTGIIDLNFCLAIDDKLKDSNINFFGDGSIDTFGLDSEIFTSKKDGFEPLKPQDIINIYVLPMGENIAGYAAENYSKKDDNFIALNSTYLNNIEKNNHLSNVLVHLLGDFLGLNELWFEINKCSDDGIKDTPLHNGPNYEVYATNHYSTCRDFPLEMTMNFMDSNLDAFMFTNGQVFRLHQMLSDQTLRGKYANNKYTCSEQNDNLVFKNTELSNPETTIGHNSIKLYPNPAKNQITLEIIRASDASTNTQEIVISDLSGKLVSTQNIKSEFGRYFNIDLSSLEPGIYFLQVADFQPAQTLKFVVL